MLLSMLGIVAVAAAVPASAADAPHLALTVQPAGATGGSPFTVQPQVTIEDANGDAVTTSTAPVTLTLSSGSTGATLTCAAVNPAAGGATFAGCAIDKAGTGYVLTAASPGSTGAASDAFAVTVGG